MRRIFIIASLGQYDERERNGDISIIFWKDMHCFGLIPWISLISIVHVIYHEIFIDPEIKDILRCAGMIIFNDSVGNDGLILAASTGLISYNLCNFILWKMNLLSLWVV